MRRFFNLKCCCLLVLLAGSWFVNVQAQTDRGFIHPGGLHTQADFDRVKAQLAAGNAKVQQAYNVLKSAPYAQPSVQTAPMETIVRGGGQGENYINAARGATMAYQNALRWKIEDNKACANAAVRILMAWANTTKSITGNSDACLAVGLYGYQFAQAAELMRDYEGWSQPDFETFQQWMLNVWYPPCISFLRTRNGTWENPGRWWQAPGHYWSNWGLCNVLCCISIGILCDDVFIYNQGMSFFKYDQVGTFKDPRTEVPILNDGLTEFLGNLVVTTTESELETGAYGRLGQMNESGRDAGHCGMALGLAVDVAKVGWNQGDDLFAYMDHRLAAGIEYVAAQSQNVGNLPWVNYHYATSGFFYTDSRAWLMTEPAMGAHVRPVWGTVIGIYEGVKGVPMPFSEAAYKQMGIDAGGQGGTSGGYDHLGYSVLMNTRDEQLCPAEGVPTELTPRMEYSAVPTANLIPSLPQEKTRKLVNGNIICHNELGGLVNTYSINNKTTVPQGQTVRLIPQLPEGEEDTGLWHWESGENTHDITVETNQSHIYRVHYTNARGVESQLSFAIAVQGDCTPTPLTASVTYNGQTRQDSVVNVLYGKTVELSVTPAVGWGTYKWSGGQTTQTITSKGVTAETELSVSYTNQGGAVTTKAFRLRPVPAEPYIAIDDSRKAGTETVVQAGQTVTLGLTLPTAVRPANVRWSTGETGASVMLADITTSQEVTATFTLRDEEVTVNFGIFVREADDSRLIEPGRYVLRHVPSGRVLTAHGRNQTATFEPLSDAVAEDGQIWVLDRQEKPKYNFVTPDEELKLTAAAKTGDYAFYPFSLLGAEGSNRLAMYTGTANAPKFWNVNEDGTIDNKASQRLLGFPFELVREELLTGILSMPDMEKGGRKELNAQWFDMSGRAACGTNAVRRGIYVVNGKKIIIK